MSPHMAKVMPAGTKRLGYISESWPVLYPLMGKMFANALSVIINAKENRVAMASAIEFVFIFYDFHQLMVG